MDIQKRTALLQIMDPITKQQMASIREDDFAKFFTKIMNFANNASMGVTPVVEKNLNAVGETKEPEEDA